MKVAFLGPEGTFSEEALLRLPTAGIEVEPVPLPTIYECVMAVADGRCERALVPIENSLEGSVNATLDALVFETDEVQIVGEVVHPITHTLIARTQLPLERIERVLSHPQASAQCAQFLRERLGAGRGDGRAEHRRRGADRGRVRPAVGRARQPHLRRAVRLRGPGRTASRTRPRTRPGSSGWKRAIPPQTGRSAYRSAALSFKTSVVFWGLPDHPGALVDVLQEFATREINLSKIESRPRKQGLGRYVFFADLAGRADDPPVVAALEAIGATVETLRVLGCYPSRLKGAGVRAVTLSAPQWKPRPPESHRRGPQGKAGRRTGSVSQPGNR